VIKRRHGLARCRYHGIQGMRRWVGLGVIADIKLVRTPRYNTYLDFAMPIAWIRFALQDTVIIDRRQSRHQLPS
jgi:hypothetical protein